MRFHGHTGPALYPLCGTSDSTPHTLPRCTDPHINTMHIKRPNEALSSEEISKGDPRPDIVTTDACNRERLSSLEMEVPDEVQRSIPQWMSSSS
mmetsp:Transcript_17261/g.45207  ORF Transcript_17261/g.45207 Transcript_17261/m.45207 type:complete len:94 (+) Transcript_17261:341-622(+)